MGERARYSFGTFGLEVTMIGVGVVFAFPIYVLVVLAFKPRTEWAISPLSLPAELYLGNFAEAWQKAYLGDALTSSVVILVASLMILIAAGSLGGFFLARCLPRLGNALYFIFLAGMILPFQLALIPLYQMMRDLGLLGTPLSLILFHGGLHLPLALFLYTGFIRSIPRAYEEAARIDGASDLQVFALVVFPMLRPVTGTVMIICGVFTWNDFMTALLYLSGSDWATVPVTIYSFVDQYVTEWGIVFASLLIGIMPVLAVFLLLQRHMIKGFASGVKG